VRTFIAIELPDAVKEALGELSRRLRVAPVPAAWVRPENIHLTLRFLGDVDEPHLAQTGGYSARCVPGFAAIYGDRWRHGRVPNARAQALSGWAWRRSRADWETCNSGRKRGAGHWLVPEERKFQPH